MRELKPCICKVWKKKRETGRVRAKKGIKEWDRIKSDMKNDLSLPAFLIYSRHDNEQ